MDAPIPLTQSALTQPLPSKTIVKKRQLLEPRSSGFVVPSKSAEHREYEDAHHFHGIRDFLSEKDGTPSGDDAKPSRRKHFFATSKHLRKIFQMQPKLEEAINLPIAYYKTWDGQQYRQIYYPGNTVSTYEVNNIKRSTASKRSRKSLTTSARVAKESKSEQLAGEDTVEAEDAVEAESIRRSEKKRGISRRQSYEATAIEDLPTRTLTSKFADQIGVTPKGQSSKCPKPYIDTPAIPLSPMKVSLGGDWLQGSSSQHARHSPTASCEPSQEPKDLPVIRDYAIDGSDKFYQCQARQRKLRTSDKKRNKKASDDHTVAGMSHDYFGFPSVKWRTEDPQGSVIGSDTHVANVSTPTSPGTPPPAPPSSPLSPFNVTSDSSTRYPLSDPSSGVLSDAQHATSMRSQMAAEQYMSGARQLPSPGPAPTSALPLVPEAQRAVAASMLKASGSDQRRGGTTCSPTKKSRSRISPKKHEYSFFPPKCNSPKASRPTSPVQKHIMTLSDVASPLPLDGRIKQYGASGPPPEHTSRDTSKGDSDPAQQRFLQTAGREEPKLTSATRQTIPVEPERVAAPQAPNSIQQPDSIKTSPDTGRCDINTPVSLQPTTFSHTLSSVIVVAERKPTYPPPSRMPSQKSNLSHTSTDSHPREQRRVNGCHGMSAQHQPTSPITSLPEATEAEPYPCNSRPLSTSSLPPQSPPLNRAGALNLPVRAPTSQLHAPSRARSTCSTMSHRTSIVSNKREHSQVSELEARLAAIEKKNVLLERAFLAVINAGVSLDLGGAYGDAEHGAAADGMSNGYGIGNGYDNGDRDGDGPSIAERGDGGGGGCRESVASGGSLYTGLEHLLAVHAGEMGIDRRVSGGSGT